MVRAADYATPASTTVAGDMNVNVDGEVQWRKDFADREEVDGSFPADIAIMTQSPTTFQARRDYSQRWNRGVFAPTVAAPTTPHEWVHRHGDTITVAPPAFADGAGRPGGSTTTAARTTLYRDGSKVGEEANLAALFTVPP